MSQILNDYKLNTQRGEIFKEISNRIYTILIAAIIKVANVLFTIYVNIFNSYYTGHEFQKGDDSYREYIEKVRRIQVYVEMLSYVELVLILLIIYNLYSIAKLFKKLYDLAYE